MSWRRLKLSEKAGPKHDVAPDGAAREPRGCCKSCYPRSASPSQRTSTCCRNCQYNSGAGAAAAVKKRSTRYLKCDC
eukprot:COSAG02_NODE_1078_length_14712_cov_9.462054_4_plen_77_part_00